MALGLLVGLGLFTFYYARGHSYFADDPKACVNCHIMRDQYDGWNRSSHKGVATCNTCHTPKNILGKYAVKGINGWNHSAAFTSGHFHEPLQINSFNRKIVLNNCMYCHKEIVSQMATNTSGEKMDCLSCHSDTGH